MIDDEITDSYDEFERSYNKKVKEKYLLRLYVAGMTPKSLQAVENIKKICEEKLKGRYELEVVDISQQPEVLKKQNLIATPTLIKELPKPIRRLIGDLSNKERILVGLNLTEKKSEDNGCLVRDE
jgi:circadian clock protein KaiB